MTYGNTVSAGVRDFEMHAKKNKIIINYSKSILMVDNYLPLFNVEDQIRKEGEKQIDKNLQEIVTDIKNSSQSLEKSSVAKILFTKLMQMIYR